MSFQPSIRELQVRLARCHADARAIGPELRHAADVIDRAGVDATSLNQAVSTIDELLSIASHLNGWVNQPPQTQAPIDESTLSKRLNAERARPKMPIGMLDYTAVCKRIGITNGHLYKLVGRGEFPSPESINGRNAWPESAADEYLDKRGNGARA